MSGIDSPITGLIAAQRGGLGAQVNYAVAAKQLDALEQQGQAAVELLESAVQLSKAVGKGGQIDSQA